MACAQLLCGDVTACCHLSALTSALTSRNWLLNTVTDDSYRPMCAAGSNDPVIRLQTPFLAAVLGSQCLEANPEQHVVVTMTATIRDWATWTARTGHQPAVRVRLLRARCGC